MSFKKAGRDYDFKSLLKSGFYFFILGFLVYFSITFSLKNREKVEGLRMGILTLINPFFNITDFALFPTKSVGLEDQSLIMQKLELETEFLKILNKREELLNNSLKSLQNTAFDLKLNRNKLVFFRPHYYSSSGFLTDVIFNKIELKNTELRPNLAVISGAGLYGRVHGVVQEKVSIVSIFNILSRIPVYTKTSKIYGLASGNGFEIIFSYPSNEIAKVVEGEEVFTSGENDLIIAEIPFGKIKKEGSRFIIEPFSPSRPEVLGIIIN